MERYGDRTVTGREGQIIGLVASGLKNREIGEQMGITEHVVKNYIRVIYDKLGMNNRVELALWFISRNGVLIFLLAAMIACTKNPVQQTVPQPTQAPVKGATVLPIIINVTPNQSTAESGQTIQFKATILNSTDTSVQWGSCASNSIDQNGLFVAPQVTVKSFICVFAISKADPSKSATVYPVVTPKKVTTLPCEPSIWSRLKKGTEYYSLPTWVTALTWIQPADIMYGTKQGQIYAVPPPLWFPPLFQPNPVCDYVLVDGGVPPYTYSATGLPSGLSITPTGLIYGTPAIGVYPNVVLIATDSKGTTVTAAARMWQICTPTQFCDGFGGTISPVPATAKPHSLAMQPKFIPPPNPHDKAPPY